MVNYDQLACKMGDILNNVNVPLKKRFRALFTLRNLGGNQSIEFINKALLNDESILLKHECCYCLGQMNDKNAIDYLINILDNKEENEIVRHEAAEALGNLLEDQENLVDKLRVHLKDESHIVNQTCELALEQIEWRTNRDANEIKYFQSLNPFQSKDPAPSFELNTNLNELSSILFDSNSKLFNKYRCLFTLRNRGELDDIKLLGEALLHFKGIDEMSLFKHEIGYIFGQMQSPDSVPFLKEIVEQKSENDIVRHEAAEALGNLF